MNILCWIRENWGLICIGLGVLVNALGLAYNVVKYVRAGGLRRAGQRLALWEAARRFECEAQAMENYTGAEKLQYVLSRLRQLTAEMGVDFDERELTEQISADVAFAKEMNATKSEELD